MRKKQVLVWGTSGHSKVVTNALSLYQHIEVDGYIDDCNSNRHGQQFEGKKI